MPVLIETPELKKLFINIFPNLVNKTLLKGTFFRPPFLVCGEATTTSKFSVRSLFTKSLTISSPQEQSTSVVTIISPFAKSIPFFKALPLP